MGKYLIADSGSTKTVWRLLSDSKLVSEVVTKGINPFLQSSEEINLSVRTELIPNIIAKDVTEIHFYGAGCANEEKNNVVKSALLSLFNSAEIFISSDMLGAARSVLGRDKGIACILGTGSNSCYYDGGKIVSNVSAGGYILGDEGSGAVIGKYLMADYIKNQMPIDVKEALENECGVSVADVIDRVYRKPFPNRYLANFTRFIHKNLDNTYLYNIVYKTFRDFFERNISQYEDSKKLPVSFVGSVAFYFSDVLEKVANDCGYKIGKIDANPIDGLVNYHID